MLTDWLWLPSILLAASATASCFAWAYNSRVKKAISFVALGLVVTLAAMVTGSRYLHEPNPRGRYGESIGYGFLAEYGLLAAFATAVCCSWVYDSRIKKAITFLAMGLAYSLAPFVIDKLPFNLPPPVFAITVFGSFPFVGFSIFASEAFYPLLAANTFAWAAVFYLLSSGVSRLWAAWRAHRNSGTVAPEQRPRD